MRKGNVIGIGVLAAAVLLGRAPTAAWADDVQADLHRAYYLQHEEKKYEAAAALYAQLAEGSDTPAAVRDTARRELDRCRAALLTADPARLMPAETLAYVEVRNTGGQIERLVEMLGLLGSPTASGQQPAADAIVPMGRPELAIPRLKISPALLREIKKVGGIAVGLTGFQPGGGRR